MYRVFEALDELSAIVEEARGVPMTAGCVVPRGDVLELIDDIKDAIPGELDDAQDVLDARDSMLHDAKTHAESMVSSATTESESMLNHARAEADRLLSDAKAQADRMVSEARQHSERMVGEAREESIRIATAAKREYEASVGRAQAEADRLIENGNISYEKAVQEGIKEQQRLVSQNEVVQAANAEATRLIDTAHAEADRLRGECDIYVDNKLAEFEEFLNGTLRSVGPRPPPTPDGGRHARLRDALAPSTGRPRPGIMRLARRRISSMTRQHSTTAQRHPTSPMTVDITRLGRRPGAMVTLRNTVPSPSRIGLDMIAIEPGAPLELDLRVESVSEGVLVTGTVIAPTVGECCPLPDPGQRARAGPVDRTVRLPGQHDRGDHRRRRGRSHRRRHHRPRAVHHRRRRTGASVLAGVQAGLPGTVPRMRRFAGRRARPSPRPHRPAVGQVGWHGCPEPDTSRGEQ